MNLQTLKGFRDFLPSQMRIRTHVMNTIRKHFERFGYEQLETPTLEYDEVLTGKYGEDEKLMYRFTDHGGRKVAMKYDLTVPAARVMAQHQSTIPLPFKRYQMQPVWRADNTQRGRYRELWQCDADTFGSTSVVAEAEWLTMGQEILTELSFNNFHCAINNRKLLNSIVRSAGGTQDEFVPIAISIDKLDKIGWDGVVDEMEKRNIPSATIQKVKSFLDFDGSNNEKINHFKKIVSNDSEGSIGIDELTLAIQIAKDFGALEKHIQFNPQIVRGLSYYTGIVWEWQIPEGNIGSVGGGGRYDNLIGMFIGKNIPAAGGSFGIERLIDILSDKNYEALNNNKTILITQFDDTNNSKVKELATNLRQIGFSVTYYPEIVKLEKQLKYADQKNIRFVMIYGPDEVQSEQIQIKDLSSRQQTKVQLSQVIEWLSKQ